MRNYFWCLKGPSFNLLLTGNKRWRFFCTKVVSFSSEPVRNWLNGNGKGVFKVNCLCDESSTIFFLNKSIQFIYIEIDMQEVPKWKTCSPSPCCFHRNPIIEQSIKNDVGVFAWLCNNCDSNAHHVAYLHKKSSYFCSSSSMHIIGKFLAHSFGPRYGIYPFNFFDWFSIKIRLFEFGIKKLYRKWSGWKNIWVKHFI